MPFTSLCGLVRSCQILSGCWHRFGFAADDSEPRASSLGLPAAPWVVLVVVSGAGVCFWRTRPLRNLSMIFMGFSWDFHGMKSCDFQFTSKWSKQIYGHFGEICPIFLFHVARRLARTSTKITKCLGPWFAISLLTALCSMTMPASCVCSCSAWKLKAESMPKRQHYLIVSARTRSKGSHWEPGSTTTTTDHEHYKQT